MNRRQVNGTKFRALIISAGTSFADADDLVGQLQSEIPSPFTMNLINPDRTRHLLKTMMTLYRKGISDLEALDKLIAPDSVS